MFKTRRISAALLLSLWGCTDATIDSPIDEESDTGAATLHDLGPNDPPGADRGLIHPEGPQDAALRFDARPDPDLGPPQDAQWPPDPPLDQGPEVSVEGPLTAAVVISESAQADLAEITVSVAEPLLFGGEPGCQVQRVNPALTEPALPSVDAGEISVHGLAGGQSHRFRWRAGHYESAQTITTPLLPSGGVVQVSGAGSVNFPAYEQSLAVPSSVQLSQPSNLDSQSRQQALDIQWAPAGGDLMLTTLIPTDGRFSTDPVAGNWIFCTTDDTGQLTVPGTLMGQLPSGGLLGQGLLVAVTRLAIASQSLGAERESVLAISTSAGALISLQ